MHSPYQAVRILFSSARVRVGVIATAAFSALGVMTDGYGYWSWVSQNWKWVRDWVASPYFYWGFCSVVFLLILFGINGVMKASARGLETYQKNLISQRAAYDASLKAMTASVTLPALLMSSMKTSRVIIDLMSRRTSYRASLSAFENYLSSYLGEKGPLLHAVMQPFAFDLLGSDVLAISNIITANALNLNLPSIYVPDRYRDREDHMNGFHFAGFYDVSNKQYYVSQEKANARELTDFSDRLGRFIDTQMVHLRDVEARAGAIAEAYHV